MTLSRPGLDIGYESENSKLELNPFKTCQRWLLLLRGTQEWTCAQTGQTYPAKKQWWLLLCFEAERVCPHIAEGDTSNGGFFLFIVHLVTIVLNYLKFYRLETRTCAGTFAKPFPVTEINSGSLIQQFHGFIGLWNYKLRHLKILIVDRPKLLMFLHFSLLFFSPAALAECNHRLVFDASFQVHGNNGFFDSKCLEILLNSLSGFLFLRTSRIMHDVQNPGRQAIPGGCRNLYAGCPCTRWCQIECEVILMHSLCLLK